ncbi:MAG: undecaprenyldiphospho-muramoylpentapeptide beta-N-acetylglucosaminyltransferase [Oscillospiraceae bacterium]|nr:undecaprenyldiphospho-muramoylpentapeptide beta-N-acetylglucosaminyltransferase [Oscillospiraceae bacterium]
MKFIFTCGGTAGHINPALAIAGRLQELFGDCKILFIGAKGMMETELVPREGYEIREIEITNISRSRSLEGIAHNLHTLKNVAVSTEKAKKIIRDFKPDAVIGTGGYVCFPVLTAAARLHIPTLVHESNAVPGLTTKMLAGQVDRVMVGFEDSLAQYPKPDKVSVTGTPVRGSFSSYTKETAKKQLGIPDDRPLVVSVWGSLGAGHMNEIMAELIPMMKADQSFRLIHSAGGAYFEDLCGKLDAIAPDYRDYGADVRRYIYDMPRVMAAADLVLCRAGASSLAELTYLGKPAVIVPSPNVTNNHQEKNARVLEKAGGAKVFLEGEFDAQSLFEEIRSLLADKDRLSSMREAMLSLAVPDAADKICGIILDTLR